MNNLGIDLDLSKRKAIECPSFADRFQGKAFD